MRFGVILCFFVTVFAALLGQSVVARPVIQVQAQIQPRAIDGSGLGIHDKFEHSVSSLQYLLVAIAFT